ncbi:MAG TPA: hypothetical protein VN609_10985, partial [Propionibacteriaceae bacterium]|nr:hypothetical protein [Propionibacteriaceae bacterium]
SPIDQAAPSKRDKSRQTGAAGRIQAPLLCLGGSAKTGRHGTVSRQTRSQPVAGSPGSEPVLRADFEIVTEPGHGTGEEDWTVKGIWHGARRVLFMGDVFECCRWVRRQLLEVAG